MRRRQKFYGQKFYAKFVGYFVSLFLLVQFAACSEYWWSRGQPPSTEELFSKAEEEFDIAVQTNGQNRRDILNGLTAVRREIDTVHTAIEQQMKTSSVALALDSLIAEFVKLEGELTYTSRPAYGELSSELRAFRLRAKAREKINVHAFKLFAARTLKFLASEVSLTL